MALTSTQVLGAIVAPRAPLFTGPHRLTVQDCGARLALSSGRLAHPSADRVIDSFPDPCAAPRPEIMIDRAPSWQIMGQQFPSTATANCVTNPIQDLTPSVFGGTPAVFGGGNKRRQAAPFGIGEITVVRSAAFHLDSVTGKSARAHLFKRALRLFVNDFTKRKCARIRSQLVLSHLLFRFPARSASVLNPQPFFISFEAIQ